MIKKTEVITINKTIAKIRRYKELKADIIDIDIRLQELDEEMIGIIAQPDGEMTSKTYKITSTVENQAEKHMKKTDGLLKKRAYKEREVKKIENAISVLTEEEYDIIETIHIKGGRWWKLEEKYNKTYRALKYIEENAVKKMEKYLA